MLQERHPHECSPRCSCGRTLWHNTAVETQSHTLFNQGFFRWPGWNPAAGRITRPTNCCRIRVAGTAWI